jgi:hypothetical protein
VFCEDFVNAAVVPPKANYSRFNLLLSLLLGKFFLLPKCLQFFSFQEYSATHLYTAQTTTMREWRTSLTEQNNKNIV